MLEYYLMSRDIWPICHRPAVVKSGPHGTDHIHSFEDFEDGSPENPKAESWCVPHSYFQVKDIRARFQVTPEKSS